MCACSLLERGGSAASERAGAEPLGCAGDRHVECVVEGRREGFVVREEERGGGVADGGCGGNFRAEHCVRRDRATSETRWFADCDRDRMTCDGYPGIEQKAGVSKSGESEAALTSS